MNHSSFGFHYGLFKQLVVFKAIIASILVVQCTRIGQADDWPTYRHDQQRSGKTAESIDAARLSQAWSWQSSQWPASAWPDSARWDAYALVDGLRSMRDYDPVFHPVVVGQRVFLPSNADDTVRCLDLQTGNIVWQFTADAPVRIAPTVFRDRVFFGSDDGRVYSLAAESGQLNWVMQAAASGQTFLNDGRICSFEPVRSGVLIDAEASLAIVSAGMFPWRPSFLVALSIEDGSLQWKKDLGKGWSLEGAMLLASQHIVAPQGRVAPQLFQRADGNPVGPLEGGGGSFVLVTDDDEVLHGPGNKSGWITQSKAGTRERVATFEHARAIVLNDDFTFLLDDSRLHALDRTTNTIRWSIDCDCPHELVLAGDTLFAGGNDLVRGFDATSGRLIWKAPVQGRAMGVVAANGHLLVSTDEGSVHAFAPTGLAQVHHELADGKRADRIYTYPLAAPQPVVDPNPNLLDRWVFHADQVIGVGPENKRMVVRSLVVDSQENQGESKERANFAGLSERYRFVPAGLEQALLLDGRTKCEISADGTRKARPTKQLTVTAWARLDREQALGGIASMMHDDGERQSGWVLGFRQNQFALGLRCSNGHQNLTWIHSEQSSFEPGRWYFVAGTYDGKTARLFVNQQIAASESLEGGDILYGDRASYQLGAYKTRDAEVRSEGVLNEVRVYDRALSDDELKSLALEKADRFPETASAVELSQRSQLLGSAESPIDRGPFIEFNAPQTATIRWWTRKPQQSLIELLPHAYSSAQVHIPSGSEPKTEHQAVIAPVRRHEVLKFRLSTQDNGQMDTSGYFECDGHFDFTRPSLGSAAHGVEGDDVDRVAKQLCKLLELNEPRGWGIVVGTGEEARLAESVSRLSGVDIVVLENNIEQIQTARERLLKVGIYGRPVTVRQWPTGDQSSLPNRAADFVIVLQNASSLLKNEQNGPPPAFNPISNLKQLLLMVQPGGKAVIPTEMMNDDLLIAPDSGLRLQRRDDVESKLTVITVPKRAGSADWTHTYGSPDNSAYSGETLSGASRQEDLTLVWAGRPGPRYQSDRGNRKPSPLSTAGRLYMQGLKRLISLDAYNGTILWSLELPEAVRFNIPRDCSNWCADDANIYLAARDRCLVIDSASGTISHQWEVFRSTDQRMDWGFVAREGDLLIGSSTASGAAFTEFWGGENWYDEKTGEHAKKVCSDSLFATDVASGQLVWSYEGGLLVNSTITIAGGVVYALVCKSQELKQSETRRLDGDEFWNNMHLVALDAQTGVTRWDVPAKPIAGKTAVYLAAADGKLILVTSLDGTFGVYALDADTGENLWRGRFNWQVDHHGKHLSRPAIVDGKIFLRPLTLDLGTGKVLSETFPEGHQCGTYSASRYALFLRAGELAVWDQNTGQSTRWDRVRPDCWISTIPAQGMLLSPEGGGGCSCGGWIETSMAFAPTVEQEMRELAQ